MNIDRAIIKYSCRLMNRRIEIGYLAINEHRTLTELEWVSERMKLIRKVQLLGYSV